MENKLLFPWLCCAIGLSGYFLVLPYFCWSFFLIVANLSCPEFRQTSLTQLSSPVPSCYFAPLVECKYIIEGSQARQLSSFNGLHCCIAQLKKRRVFSLQSLFSACLLSYSSSDRQGLLAFPALLSQQHFFFHLLISLSRLALSQLLTSLCSLEALFS